MATKTNLDLTNTGEALFQMWLAYFEQIVCSPSKTLINSGSEPTHLVHYELW